MNKFKAFFALLLLLATAAGLFACGAPASGEDTTEPAEQPRRAVALSSSLAEIWLLAGGSLVGTSSDTLERGFEGIPQDIAVVGTVKDPSLEAIMALEPDFVILSAVISGHTAIEQTLKDADISYYYAHVETFGDYMQALELFCGMTGRPELLEQNGTRVQAQISALLQDYTPPDPPETYLLLRVHSSGGKVIAGDHVACDILTDLHVENIAAQSQSLLSDLSLEAILVSDPGYIFVVTMGDEAAALQTLEQVFTAQPAWQELSAVRDGRVNILPKELFHYKPNAKWGDAYEALISLLES